MRRIGNLFSNIFELKVLYRAFWLASRGSSSSKYWQEFGKDIDRNLLQIARQVRSGSYRFGPYEAFDVWDTKSRVIHAPPLRDRVLHHAIIHVTGNAFELSANTRSFACRKYKGVHRALSYAKLATREHAWYGKVDVEKYYDSIDHYLLMEMLRRRFQEKSLLDLFENLLNSYSQLPGKGVPIGALTSQYLGNFYLDPVDRAIDHARLIPMKMRYMDDMLFWGAKQEVLEAKDLVIEELNKIQLRAKHSGEWNQTRQGVPCLGFVIYPNRVRLNKQGRKRLRRRYHQATRQYRRGGIGESQYQAKLTSLFAHALHSNDITWRRNWLSWQRDPTDLRDA